MIEAIGLTLAALDFLKLTVPAEALLRKLAGWLQDLFGEMEWSTERLVMRGKDGTTIVYKPMFYFAALFVWLPSVALSVALWWNGDIPWFAVPIVLIISSAILIAAFWLSARLMLFALGVLMALLATIKKAPKGVFGVLGLLVAATAYFLPNG
jgi:hypothetical protein